MITKTHILNKYDYISVVENEKCEFCNNDAHYWTQSEDKEGLAYSRCVWHCQKHRNDARSLVDSMANIDYRIY